VIEHLAWREKNGRAILTDPDADDLRDECRRRTREIRDAVVASWRVHRHEDYSRIKANSYGRRHVLRQDFDEALKGLDGLDDRVRVASLLQREILGSDVALTELQAFTESRVAAMPEVSSAEEWEHTAAELRRRVLDEIVFRGEAARWRQAQTHVKWLETIEGGPGYHIRKLRYEALPGLWIPALLYEPDGLAGKVPAILNVNGHEVRGKAAPYKQIRCINMAKRGMLALNVEWLGLGQLATEGFRHGHMNQLDLCGTSGLAPFYLALERALDLLLSLEHADPERIAVAGLSGGGWQTILVGSLDPRVTLANPVAGYDSYRTRARNLSDLGDSEQTPTDLAALADYTHLTALRAPRPTLLTYNDKDVYFASARALPPLLEAAEPIFALFGAEERLRTHTNSDPGDHNFEKDNREALYRALGDYFYAGQEFDAAEIPCEDELKSAGELTVPLPAETVDFHSLALELSKRLPHGRGVPEDPAALAAWQRERRRELSQLVRSKPCAVEAERVGEGRSGEFSAAFWQLHVGTEWTLPAVELVRGTPTGTVLLVADGGRSSAVSEIERLLAGGKRVIAVDPFGYGEAGTGRWHALFSLLVSSVGERTLGIEADQIAAVARWAGEQSTVVAIGPRTCLAALTATALDESTIAALELSGGLRSLHDVIDRNWSVEQAPELFCFGLLEHFDIEQLAALVAPRPVAFR
jgi:dienelactone hydrolase